MIATARPPGETSTASRTWAVEAEDYDAALERVKAEVPAGSILLFVRVHRDPGDDATDDDTNSS